MSEQARRIVVWMARGLVAITAAVALVVAVYAFLDGRELRYPDGVERHDAGGIVIVMFLVPLIAPGLLVWRRARPRFIWSWVAVGWLVGGGCIAYLADNHPRPDEVLPAFHVVKIGSFIAAGLVMFGTPLLGFAMAAASAVPASSSHRLARWLRLFTKVAVALGAIIAACGFLPGTHVYDDSRNCFGQAIGAMFTEARASGCEPSYDQLTETRMAGGIPLLLYMLFVLGPAILVHADPRARRAWQWALWSFVAALVAVVMFFALMFRLDLFSHTVTLWPARVVEAGVALLQLLLMVALPILAVLVREPPARDSR